MPDREEIWNLQVIVSDYECQTEECQAAIYARMSTRLGKEGFHTGCQPGCQTGCQTVWECQTWRQGRVRWGGVRAGGERVVRRDSRYPRPGDRDSVV